MSQQQALGELAPAHGKKPVDEDGNQIDSDRARNADHVRRQEPAPAESAHRPGTEKDGAAEQGQGDVQVLQPLEHATDADDLQEGDDQQRSDAKAGSHAQSNGVPAQRSDKGSRHQADVKHPRARPHDSWCTA